ncbi:SDR family NAD(P)-dependent oxidoreductase [Pseudomonas fluorescens]|uniref:Levodione reductase n=1 Tax=Pseudomonas fluorescens TaxID=294 RepID=A0A5E7E4J4_PSEFL|nr:SDR family NAD(P)-dependent oxidoreductase [Pseudomonas fluorescens]VVO21332.1 Levodione reductase [Pseudomonas fluorescens]
MNIQVIPVAVITGAAGGIGAALAKRLNARGCRVVLVDRDHAALRRLAQDLGLTASDSLLVTADVSQEADVRNYVEQAVARFGRIDYFGNNAGIEGSPALIEDQSVEMFDKVYAVNVRGVFMGLKYVLPVMKRQGKGSIVNMSSLAGISSGPTLSPYIMSKHAVIGLTRTAAAEAATAGVRVNAVLPGTINTEMMRRIESDSGQAATVHSANTDATPLGRYGEPEEVAALINFLFSDEASYVTSSLYTIDGGMSVF